jgi:hypothetical protein
MSQLFRPILYREVSTKKLDIKVNLSKILDKKNTLVASKWKQSKLTMEVGSANRTVLAD